jgi:hypothetical protein
VVLVAHVETSDGRLVPCAVTALLFGREDASLSVPSGSDVALKVGMLTPLYASPAFKVRMALRVQCEGHQLVTTPERDVDLALFARSRVDFGTISVR